METGIVLAGMVVLAIMVIAAAYMRANRRPAVVAVAPLGLQNPNAVMRTPINSDNVVNQGFSLTEMNTVGFHFLSLVPQPAVRLNLDVLRREAAAADGTRRIGRIARIRYDRLG